MYWWVRQYPVCDAAQEAKVEKKSAIQAYQYLRDIYSWRLLNQDAPLLLGGPGTVVQIDESLFRHKPKVSAKFHQCLIYNYYSITEVDLQHKRYGCLEWWTPVSLQLLE